jgi:hypothetical protein
MYAAESATKEVKVVAAGLGLGAFAAVEEAEVEAAAADGCAGGGEVTGGAAGAAGAFAAAAVGGAFADAAGWLLSCCGLVAVLGLDLVPASMEVLCFCASDPLPPPPLPRLRG